MKTKFTVGSQMQQSLQQSLRVDISLIQYFKKYIVLKNRYRTKKHQFESLQSKTNIKFQIKEPID